VLKNTELLKFASDMPFICSFCYECFFLGHTTAAFFCVRNQPVKRDGNRARWCNSVKQASHWHEFCSRNAPLCGVPFSWHEVYQDGKVTHSLRHIVPSVTHKLRTVHEMRDTQWHACALDKLWQSGKFFEHFKIFATTWHALLHLTHIAARAHPRTLSPVRPSLVRQIARDGANHLQCQCEACLISELVAKAWSGQFRRPMINVCEELWC